MTDSITKANHDIDWEDYVFHFIYKSAETDHVAKDMTMSSIGRGQK